MSRHPQQFSSRPADDDSPAGSIKAMYYDFIIESNSIEGIERPPTKSEIDEMKRFMDLSKVTVEDIQHFVAVYEPGAVLRDRAGRNVQVNTFRPPEGGLHVRYHLSELLRGVEHSGSRDIDSREAFQTHIRYERLHPFTDCNGRSGRMLWAWHMRHFPLGFLHTFYYQGLEHGGA
jgi:hypothetical protein